MTVKLQMQCSGEQGLYYGMNSFDCGVLDRNGEKNKLAFNLIIKTCIYVLEE